MTALPSELVTTVWFEERYKKAHKYKHGDPVEVAKNRYGHCDAEAATQWAPATFVQYCEYDGMRATVRMEGGPRRMRNVMNIRPRSVSEAPVSSPSPLKVGDEVEVSMTRHASGLLSPESPHKDSVWLPATVHAVRRDKKIRVRMGNGDLDWRAPRSVRRRERSGVTSDGADEVIKEKPLAAGDPVWFRMTDHGAWQPGQIAKVVDEGSSKRFEVAKHGDSVTRTIPQRYLGRLIKRRVDFDKPGVGFGFDSNDKLVNEVANRVAEALGKAKVIRIRLDATKRETCKVCGGPLYVGLLEVACEAGVNCQAPLWRREPKVLTYQKNGETIYMAESNEGGYLQATHPLREVAVSMWRELAKAQGKGQRDGHG